MAPVMAANKTSFVTVTCDNGDVKLIQNESKNMPINVFIASFLPKILIEKNTSGIPSINIIIDTDNPLILLKTTDRPLSPPGAIV